jgi:hypothetical protein
MHLENSFPRAETAAVARAAMQTPKISPANIPFSGICEKKITFARTIEP